MKKLSIFVLTFLSAFLLVACKDKTPPVVEGDTTPPVFTEAIGGKLRDVTHLEGDTFDFNAGIKVMDNETPDDEIVVTVDMKNYDNTKPGTYTITYTAKDKAGNQSSVDRTVIVLEAVEATFPAIVIGDSYIRYDLNNDDAFRNIGSNAQFRLTSELVTVMDKDFYLGQLEEHASEWEANNGIPSFSWGVVVVLDDNNKVVQARFAQGAQMQMDANGELLWGAEDFPWYASHGGGNLLVGLGKEELDELIPEGGKILLAAANTGSAPDLARIFLINNIFWTGYVGGGGVVKDVQDVDVTNVEFTFEENFTVKVEKPDPIETPVIEVNRHILTWNAVDNARGYNLYINGVKYNEDLLQADSIELLFMEELEVGKTYEFQVEAVSLDILKWSSSELSEPFEYERIEIKIQDDPVISYDEETKLITWEKTEGSDYVEIYAKVEGRVFLLGTTQETSFDPHELGKDFSGTTNFYIKSIGNDEFNDSQSNEITVEIALESKVMKVNGFEFKVQVIEAPNYFARRNGKLPTDFVYLVKNVKDYEFVAGDTEANLTVMVLDKDYNIKLIRNIVNNHAWTPEKGWHTDAAHPSGAQLTNIKSYMEEEDFLFVGRNTAINVVKNEETIQTTGRNILAYNFIKPWDAFPGTGEGWREDVSTFIDPSLVEFTIE